MYTKIHAPRKPVIDVEGGKSFKLLLSIKALTYSRERNRFWARRLETGTSVGPISSRKSFMDSGIRTQRIGYPEDVQGLSCS